MKTAIGLTALCVAALIAGCEGQSTSFGAIAGNPTPELQGVTERPIDIDAHLAYMRDHDWRMLSDDLGRTFYTDHPSKLSPYPIVLTSGQSR
jgi:hypothetical protein